MPYLIPASDEELPTLSLLSPGLETLRKSPNEIRKALFRMHPSQKKQRPPSPSFRFRQFSSWQIHPIGNDSDWVRQSIRSDGLGLRRTESPKTGRLMKLAVLK